MIASFMKSQRRIRRFILLCALIPVALFALSGCGDGEVSGAPVSEGAEVSPKPESGTEAPLPRETVTEAAEELYRRAGEALLEYRYRDAAELYRNAGGYRDAPERLAFCAHMMDLLQANPGETVVFGAYEQDNDDSNGPEPIEWTVLQNGENGLLLLSRFSLFNAPYHGEFTAVSWEECTLRAQLNGEFYQNAFSQEERQAILKGSAPAESLSPDEDGICEDDAVFLLSADEIAEWLPEEEERVCFPTAFALAGGAEAIQSPSKDGTVRCWYWLRTAGKQAKNQSLVTADGAISQKGRYVNRPQGTVRPAVRIVPEK